MKEGQSTFRERVLTAGIAAAVAYVAMFAGAERTAEEIRWDVLREIDGQMERGGATTGRWGNGVAVHTGSAGILPAGGAQAGAAVAGAEAGWKPTSPSGAPGGN